MEEAVNEILAKIGKSLRPARTLNNNACMGAAQNSGLNRKSEADHRNVYRMFLGTFLFRSSRKLHQTLNHITTNFNTMVKIIQGNGMTSVIFNYACSLCSNRLPTLHIVHSLNSAPRLKGAFS